MNEPRFLAYVAGDFVAAADSIDVLLNLVRDLHDVQTGEDVCCWQDGRELVCVVRGNGETVWLQTLHTAA